MRKIGIIYMCTGNYKFFWKKFYETSEKYLLQDTEKHYFVFTDAERLEYETTNDRIHRKYLEHQKWPYITLLRFDIIIKNKDLFFHMDYLFFFNANIEFLKRVEEKEFLPVGEELVIVPDKATTVGNLDDVFEKNKKSTAYVPDGCGSVYALGTLNGGTTKSFLKMAEKCNINIQDDLNRGIIAAWHDQAHLNRYIVDHPEVKLLKKEIYLAQKSVDMSQEHSKVLLLDKNECARYGKAFLRSGKSFAEDPKYRENLIVYGTGTIAERWYQKFKDKVTIKCFICSNPTIDYFHGIEVRKADKEIVKQGFVVLALVNGFSYAYALMQECGFEEYTDFIKAIEYIL